MARSTMRATCPTGIHVAQSALAAGHMSLRFRMEMMIQWAVPGVVDLWHKLKLVRKWDAGFRTRLTEHTSLPVSLERECQC